MSNSQHHELMRLVSLGELTPTEFSEITGEKFIMKTESEEMSKPTLKISLIGIFKIIRKLIKKKPKKDITY